MQTIHQTTLHSIQLPAMLYQDHFHNIPTINQSINGKVNMRHRVDRGRCRHHICIIQQVHRQLNRIRLLHSNRLIDQSINHTTILCILHRIGYTINQPTKQSINSHLINPSDFRRYGIHRCHLYCHPNHQLRQCLQQSIDQTIDQSIEISIDKNGHSISPPLTNQSVNHQTINQTTNPSIHSNNRLSLTCHIACTMVK